MFVKPADGLTVVDPARLKQGRNAALLPAEGRHVDDTDYWIRRLAAGDVVLATPDSAQPTDTAKGD